MIEDVLIWNGRMTQPRPANRDDPDGAGHRVVSTTDTKVADKELVALEAKTTGRSRTRTSQ